MTITVTGQRPAVLDPVHVPPPTGDMNPMAILDRIIGDPLRTPLSPPAPARIENDGTDITADLADVIAACLGTGIDVDAETLAKQVLGRTLTHFDESAPLSVTEVFTIQASVAHRLPFPSPRLRYTARDDVIPAAKALLADTDDDGLLLAGLAHAYRPATLGFWFQSHRAFADFSAWLSGQISIMGPALPGPVAAMLNQVAGLRFTDLTESLSLRADDADGNEELSFPRMIVNLLMRWIAERRAAGENVAGVLPFNLGELLCPRAVVLVDVEAHAHATTDAVDAEWRMITGALHAPVRLVSRGSITSLTALPRAAARATARGRLNPDPADARSASVAFRDRAPSSIDLSADLVRILRRMSSVNRSQNPLRRSRVSFSRANRRRPDDPNLPGRIVSTVYKPDLHLFVDTSGSISEANYQDAVTTLIRTARSLDVNLYVSSFSHLLSEPTLLRVRGRSTAAVWRAFRRVPKVSGGTDYRQIWEYVDASPVRRRRLSLVVTDFEWDPPAERVVHPPNLYYAPCGAMDWPALVHGARRFAAGMTHIEPAIHQRLLGLVA